MRHSTAYLMCLFTGTVWGVTFPLARVASEAGGAALGLAFWQCTIAAAVLLVVAAVMRKPLPRGRRFLWLYPLLAILGTVAPSTLYFMAAAHVPSGVLAITIAMVPIVTYALSVPLGLDQPSRLRLFGIIAGFIGILMLIAPEGALPDRGMIFWVAVAIGAVLFYCVENIVVPLYVPEKVSMVGLLAGMQIVAMIILLPVTIITDTWVSLNYPFGMAQWAIIGMGVVTAAAYTMFLTLLRSVGPVFASQVGYVSTFAGVLFGIVFFDEAHSFWVWAALAAICVGLVCVTPRRAL